MSRKKIIQVKTGIATRIVNQMSFSKNQLARMTVTPVNRIDQGWHHQGFACHTLFDGSTVLSL